MSYFIPIGERVIPVYGESIGSLYPGLSKVLTINVIVPMICPIPKFPTNTSIISPIYRFSPFNNPITYMDRAHQLVDGKYSAEIIKRTCFGFLFKYTP